MLSVPDAWLPHLAELDRQLAEIDPSYRLHQVKSKWGGLRYYLEEPGLLPCCQAWLDAHPLPDDADDAAREASDAAFEAHDRAADHDRQYAERQALRDRMDVLIRAAEQASYRW